MRTVSQIDLSDNDRRAVEAAARLLKQSFPVREVILFGSKARGEASPGSDIDLLALTARRLDWDERGRMSYDLVELGLDHGVLIELLVEEREEWFEGLGRMLSIRDQVERDGVVLGATATPHRRAWPTGGKWPTSRWRRPEPTSPTGGCTGRLTAPTTVASMP